MSLEVGVVMDPIESINFKKDSTLAMLLAAQTARLPNLHYMRDGRFSSSGTARVTCAHARALRVVQRSPSAGSSSTHPAPASARGARCRCSMRKDPPFDIGVRVQQPTFSSGRKHRERWW